MAGAEPATHLDRNGTAVSLREKVGDAAPAERQSLSSRDIGQDVVAAAAQSRSGRLEARRTRRGWQV